MNLEKLSQDIKTAMVFVANLKNENETLQSKITALELHNSTLESLLKECEQSHNDLLKQRDINENNVLDKIISLQMDHKLKEEHKTLLEQMSELELKYEEAIKCHVEEVKETEERGEERVREEKERGEKRESELLERVQELERKIDDMERESAEQRTKMQLDFEEKLQNVQRSAVSSHNIDVYKRKLAAQRMEHMHEIQRLNQQISGLQYAASRGGRGRKRGN